MKKQRHKNIPASYLILFRDDKVLLLRRCNTGYEDGNYSLIAGHVEPGENFTDCIIREAHEEAGIHVEKNDLDVAHVMHRNCGDHERVDVFFVARSWQGEIINKESEKCDDLSWFHTDTIPSNVIPYIQQALESIKNNLHYSEYGW